MDKYNDLKNDEIAKDLVDKCFNNQCNNNKEFGYDLCKYCIQEFIRICTCNKKFIIDKPKQYVIGKKNSVIILVDLPDKIPEFFYTQLNGNLYHILGCRGCQYVATGKEISVKDNFDDALQASIISCVYQRIENEDGSEHYEYLSDALDPAFENYAARQGITLGEPAKITTGDTRETGDGSSIVS
jgi:hypothetical protein